MNKETQLLVVLIFSSPIFCASLEQRINQANQNIEMVKQRIISEGTFQLTYTPPVGCYGSCCYR